GMASQVPPRLLACWVILLAVLLRVILGLHSYSGAGVPPKYGDYEAQRHWMEITINLPLSQWYTNSTQNDLAYWGLDYPPLSAYQSWVHGKVLQRWVPEAVALGSSRGIETPRSKLALRQTVLASDLAVYFPAAAFLALTLHGARLSRQAITTLAQLLLGPGLILIDHGHFQFNCINLGLTLAAVACTLRGSLLAGAALFCAALNHKQMILYFAPAFFSHMLGTCLQQRSAWGKLFLLASIGGVVLASFGIVWVPFLATPGGPLPVLRRIFPTARGLFEDYVANLWCASSLAIKWRRLLAPSQLLRLCAAGTLAAVLPAMACQLRRPTRRAFLLGLANSSLAFFLLAYQVHEKSVLLPLAALGTLGGPAAELAQYVGVYSMLPLLRKDGLATAAAAVAVAYAAVLGTLRPALPPAWRAARAVFLAGAAAITVGFWAVPPPPRYPFLEDAACMAWCCTALVCLFGYTNVLQVQECWGPGAARRGRHGKRKGA
ncbi:hypothetical protein APUTEX25_000679, partial [Auxenochlorella protothecoides]